MGAEEARVVSDESVHHRLLEAASELFARKGYASTTVREIVADAGVTKPVLYYYFGNKEGIFLELLKGPFRLFEELIEGFPSEDGSASEKLTALCEGVSQLYYDNIEIARMMNGIYYGPSQG